MKNIQIKTEIITLIFIILCTIGVIFKDYIPHNVLTSAFIHGSKDHFVNNMMLFLLLSPAVEEKLGKVNYLLSFALTTVTVHYFHTVLLHVNAIGISAWIFALIVLNIGKLKITGILLISIYAFQEISGMFNNDNTSHAGHLLGIITGIIYLLIYNYISKKKETYEQEERSEKSVLDNLSRL